MKRLVSTLNLAKEDWLRYRKCGITGTDAGAILGLNPYRSAFQVYHDKISDTIENIDNEAMRQGRDLEDYVAQRFTEATGLKVRRANAIYQSEEHPLLLADFDRLIVGQKAGLECKTVSPFSADKWADGKIPAHYLAQVDHYLAVSGFDCWYVAALIFGRELVIHKIVTDKQVLSDLIDKEELFWTNHVVPQIPPAPNGCDCDTQQINQMYEVDNRDKTADLSALHGLLDKRQALSDQIEQMEQEKTAIEQQVKLQMQDAAYGTAPGYKVSWVSSESKRVDSQRLRKEQPDMFDVNKAIMRCLVKNLAMFGLGLYVYAGEDLPEDAAPQPEAEPQKQLKPKSTSQKQEQPPVPCICTRCNQPIKRVKLKDGSIMQAAEFAATHEGMCADCYKATRLNVA